MPSWLIVVLRALGIRSAADVVPVATELAAQVHDVVDPPEPGQPLTYADVRHIQSQIESATSHKVPPPTKPRTGNPSARVVAASRPAAGRPFASPPEGGGAAGTQGEVGCLQPPDGWRCTRERGHAGPCAAEPITPADRSIITPRDGGRLAPPRPTAPRKEPEK